MKKQHQYYLYFLLLCTSFIVLHAQDNDLATKTNSAQNTGSKEISGTITYLNAPLKDVNILIKGTFQGTKTNDLGAYNIDVNVGDQLEYRHVGFEVITILIEDVTSVLNIEMDNYVTKLDEVIIDATVKTRKSSAGDEYNRKIKSSLGDINPMLMDDARYFSRNRLATQYRTLSDALKFYYPKGLPSKNFDLDGTFFEGEPFVDMSTVRDVYFIPSYPSAKLDPLDKSLIIIRTTNSEEYREITAEKYRNQTYYDNNALDSENASTFSSTKLPRNLSGIVTHLSAPIPNVNITIKGTSKGTKTNEKGAYTLKVNVGDVIEYSHLNYTTVAVMVEDVTSTLNIELQEKENELNEIVVKAKRSPKDLAVFEEKMDAEIRTSFGIFKPNATGTKVHYLSGEEIGNQYDNLPQALLGKFSGKLPGSYDVDGLPYNSSQIALLNLSNIKDVYVTKNVIVVRTMDSPEEIARQKEEKAAQYRNQNYYNADAVTTTNEATFSSNNPTKEIYGEVTHLAAPVPNVNITIKGTSKGTKTNAEGIYSIEAKVGDILEYSHVNFQTVAVIIEDVTTMLNIELREKDNALDEVVVKARVDQKALELQKNRARIMQTAVGDINLDAMGFAFSYVSGEDLPSHCDGATGDERPLECAAAQEFPFLNRNSRKPLIWDVDGMIMDRPTFIPVSIVENMWFLSNAPARYGPYRVVIVQTISGTRGPEEKEAIAEQYQNQNYYSADAVSGSDEATFSSSTINTSQPKFVISKEITGKVTYLDAPLPLVNIKVVGRNAGVVTNPKGAYSLNANVGDIIQFSHLGYATISIVVEDVTDVLNVEMVLQENELETIVLTSDGKRGATAENAKKRDQSFKTSMGNIDPKTAGYSVGYLNGEDVTAGARDLYDVLNGKIAGVTVNPVTKEIKLRSTGSINTDVPPIFDVDGVVVTYVPQVAPEDIKDIHVLKSLASTTRYGSQARGGVIVISTKLGNFSASGSNTSKIAEQYTNKDYYSNDAAQISLGSLNTNVYTDTLATFPNKQKAFIYYDENLKVQLKNYSDHISIAQKFLTHFKDPSISKHILNHLSNKHQNNAEILKAIAYQYQTIGATREAVEIYKAVVKLRPQYAQSYRDLANAYKENNQFKSAWRLYMYYIDQGNDLSSDEFGEMMYNEMEYLYYNRSHQTAIKQTFVPKSESLNDFQNDMRFVFEWNTSEAEFDLEFVSPDQRAYSFEHSLSANQHLITQEKEKGFSSKAFFIEDLTEGEWLINMTYKGNKKDAPTYFKVTKFMNWGKPNQSQESLVYRFQNEREKIQLMVLNKEQLILN